MEPLILYAAAAVFVFYLLFAAVMKFKTIRDTRGLSSVEKLIGYPVLAVAYPLDVALNITVASVLFLDPPKEWTITERLERYIFETRYYDTWREALAEWIDEKLIQPHDADHIR